MTLPIFETKKSLIESLPLMSGSDFIIYNTSEQDSTKPYVMVSFSFYDEKVGSYNYQVRISTTPGDFISGTYRKSGSSNTTYYLYGIHAYYYDALLNEWVFYSVRSRGNSLSSFLNLKGSATNIVFSTRDIYTNSSTIGYKKDSRIPLSGYFEETTFEDEIFNIDHLTSLGFEAGDDILRLKYADNHHALFVIKGSTASLKAGYYTSSSYYYFLTVNGTLSGLECKDGTYSAVSALKKPSVMNIKFDDYVVFSTLDITYEGRLMRMKNYYGDIVRDEILSISPTQIQIERPFEFEAETNPAGLPLIPLDTLSETYDSLGSYVSTFIAGNSKPYIHFYESVDTIGKWGRWPLPSKETVAQFYDGNHYRIIYQTLADRTCKMLTFNLEDDCKIYWSTSTTSNWYFTDKTKASNFKLYELSKDGIGSKTEITWYSSNANYLVTTSNIHRANVDYVLFSNIDIYNNTQSDVLYSAQPIEELSPNYFHFDGVGFDHEVRVKSGEEWKSHFKIYANHLEHVKIKDLTFNEDHQEIYHEKGSYRLTVSFKTTLNDEKTYDVPFLLNVYDDTSLSYPNYLPFPVEDGMRDFVVYQDTKGTQLMSHTLTPSVYLVGDETAKTFHWRCPSDRGTPNTSGSYYYTLNEQYEWVYQADKDTIPSTTPTYISGVNGIPSILYSTRDVYNNAQTEIIRAADVGYVKKDYHLSMQKHAIPYELPDVSEALKEDGTHLYFITYRGGYIHLVTLVSNDPDNLKLVQSYYSSSTQLTPSQSGLVGYYRRYNASSNTWGSRVTHSNITTFNSTYVSITTSSTLNAAKTAQDMIIYTTIPIIIKNSLGDEEVLLRASDVRLEVDENSQPPRITRFEVANEAPFTVDTLFDFALDYEVEDLTGVTIAEIEYENKLLYYEAGKTHVVRVRVKDNRGLYSEWAELSFEVEKPVVPAQISLENLPVKPDGHPYEHYFVAQRYAPTSSITSGAYCFAFDTKPELEDFTAYFSGSDGRFSFNDKILDLFDNAHLYSTYSPTSGWGEGSYVIPGNYNYLSANGSSYFVYGGLAKNIYASTFEIYTDNSYEYVRSYPMNRPSFPLTLKVVASHADVWTADDVTVTVNLVDNGEIWHNLHYKVNGGEPIALEGSCQLTFSESNTYHVEFFVYNADNVETKEEVFFKIDKTLPRIEIVELETQLQFNASDDHSGLQSLYYRLAENDAFVRANRFNAHLLCALNHEVDTFSDNAWVSIKNGHRIAKPVYGGTYTYELMAVDNLGHTQITQYVYDLPLIKIERVEVTPNSFELAYNNSQQLTVTPIPANHNEPISVTYESLSPYVSVSSKGLVQNVNGYYDGQAQVKVTLNQIETIVDISCKPNKLAVPSNIPSLYDLYYYIKEFTDVIVARRSATIYYVYAFNREENDGIYYINNNCYLAYTVANNIKNGRRYAKYSSDFWERHGDEITLQQNHCSDFTFYSKYPTESVVFSTVDIYSDETGELLAYAKQSLPDTTLASIRLEPTPIDGWTNQSSYQLLAEDRGGGLRYVRYIKDSSSETTIANESSVRFTKSGNYRLQAIAYNEDGAPNPTSFYDIQLDLEAPTLNFTTNEFIQVVDNKEVKHYAVSLSASDKISGLAMTAWRMNDGDWTYFDGAGVNDATYELIMLNQLQAGSYLFEAITLDQANNESIASFVLEVEPIATPCVHLKLNNSWIAVVSSLTPTAVRVRVNNEWLFLATTQTPTPVRVRVSGVWQYLKVI